MSPEQAALCNVDVDTRSDIYSLGVLLYELLTGTTPLDRVRLKEADYDQLRRIIREEEPPRPSTRIRALGQAATTVSTQRNSYPKRLSQLLRGELDWIVMTALEKDRNRRYESASGMAADVQHYLHDEPVQACPPSRTYRLGKFVRRNNVAFGVASLIAAALALAVVVLAISNARINFEKDQKDRALEQANAASQRERNTALRFVKFLKKNAHMVELPSDQLVAAFLASNTDVTEAEVYRTFVGLGPGLSYAGANLFGD